MSLSVAEIAGRIVSLVTFVYLARVLSPDGFGVIGFATAFVSYFILIVNFGFETYGTQEIAKNMLNNHKLVNSILTIRFFISVCIFIILVVCTIILKKNLIVKIAIILTGINLFATAFSLNWYFQGIQRMGYIAVSQILSGILSLSLVFLFVKNNYGILLSIAIMGLSTLVNSLLLMKSYNKSFGKFHFQLDKVFVKKIITDSTPFAFSSIMITIYYNLDMIMLGFMKSDYEVGIYNASVKIFLIGNVSYILIMKSFFPTFSEIGFSITNKFYKNFRNYFLSMVSIGLFTTIIMFLFSIQLIYILFGKAYYSSIYPLQILAMNSAVVCINIIFGNPLLTWGKQKIYLIIVGLGAITNILMNLILIPHYSYIGAALATLISEVAVFFGLIIVYSNFRGTKLAL